MAGWEFEERDMETESGWQRWRLTCDYDTRARTALVCGSQSAKMKSNGEGGCGERGSRVAELAGGCDAH